MQIVLIVKLAKKNLSTYSIKRDQSQAEPSKSDSDLEFKTQDMSLKDHSNVSDCGGKFLVEALLNPNKSILQEWREKSPSSLCDPVEEALHDQDPPPIVAAEKEPDQSIIESKKVAEIIPENFNVSQKLEDNNSGEQTDTYSDLYSDVETDEEFQENNAILLMRSTEFRRKCNEGICGHKNISLADSLLQETEVGDVSFRPEENEFQRKISKKAIRDQLILVDSDDTEKEEDAEEKYFVFGGKPVILGEHLKKTGGNAFILQRTEDGDLYGIDLEERRSNINSNV